MPASRRPHRTLAVLVHCLGVLAALPALPAVTTPAQPTPPAVAPSAAPRPVNATPGTTPAAPRGPAPAIRVVVDPARTPAPAYRILVRNDGYTAVQTTVRQELPPGASATVITAGGRATRAGGGTGPGEVTWRLTVAARSTRTLNTALAGVTGNQSLTAPACAFATDGSRPYDCATATWHRAAADDAPQGAATPLWRRPTTALAGVAASLLLGTGWWLLRRRRSPGTAPTQHTDAPAARGTLYPRPAVPSPAYRRRRPPVWLVVGVATAILVAVVGAATWTATTRVAAIDTAKQPTSGAWTGQGETGPVGVPLREAAFEFTVYRVACGGPEALRRCQATVGVRNLTPEEQVWHGQLQRAYLPTGGWVTADQLATRAANQGRDVFAEPFAAGRRMVLPLVFTVREAGPPKQLELRSGVFSAGVRVDVP